jgi:dienelactone hydrolase
MRFSESRHPISVNILVLPLLAATVVSSQDLARGRTIDDVKCVADPSQSYALYLPSGYTPERTWSVLLAFHPGANGRAMVEKFRAAAEQYGYIVAGSNNSRNGPWAVSAAAVKAMSADVGSRFAIDPRHLYLTGMSGGARVAFQVALSAPGAAGVIASSAGFPDNQPRTSVPFAVFSTAGTEDFNHLEMRQLDRRLKSPHRLVVFEGGHTLPPDEVAFEAVEWMELQAMKSGRRPRDEVAIDRIFETRRRQLAATTDPLTTVHQLETLVEDFGGLRDVTAFATRLVDLTKQSDIKKAIARERADDEAEARMLGEIVELEAGLQNDDRRTQSLLQLRDRLSRMARTANGQEDTPERRLARRVLRQITAGAPDRVKDADYLKILQEYRAPGRGRN